MEVQEAEHLGRWELPLCIFGDMYSTGWKSVWKCAPKSPSLLCSREQEPALATSPGSPWALQMGGVSHEISVSQISRAEWLTHPKMESLCLSLPLRRSWFSLRHLISFTESKHPLPSLAPLLGKSDFTAVQDLRYTSSLRLCLAGSHSVLWKSFFLPYLWERRWINARALGLQKKRHSQAVPVTVSITSGFDHGHSLL